MKWNVLRICDIDWAVNLLSLIQMGNYVDVTLFIDTVDIWDVPIKFLRSFPRLIACERGILFVKLNWIFVESEIDK